MRIVSKAAFNIYSLYFILVLLVVLYGHNMVESVLCLRCFAKLHYNLPSMSIQDIDSPAPLFQLSNWLILLIIFIFIIVSVMLKSCQSRLLLAPVTTPFAVTNPNQSEIATICDAVRFIGNRLNEGMSWDQIRIEAYNLYEWIIYTGDIGKIKNIMIANNTYNPPSRNLPVNVPVDVPVNVPVDVPVNVPVDVPVDVVVNMLDSFKDSLWFPVVVIASVTIIFVGLAEIRNRIYPDMISPDTTIPSDSLYSFYEPISSFNILFVWFVTGFAVICTGVLLYIFKSKGTSNPGKDIPDDLCKDVTDPSKYATTSSIVKYVVTVYASWILFIRSFFIKEHPWLIPLLLLLAHVNLYYQIYPIIDLTFIMRFFLWLGMYCLAIDSLGSLISTYALSGTSNLFDQVLPLLTKKHSNIILEYYCSIGLTALIVGKTAMTATGRAALGVGLISGAGYLINAQLDRQHQAEENKQTRDAASQEAQRQRDYTSQEAQRQRDYTSQEAQKQRDYTSQEAQKQRDWQDQKDRQQAYKSSWYPFKKKPPK